MKRFFRKSQKIVKGMPSAVLLSIVIHVALFLLAGMLVVFTVVKKEEKKFEPPKAVERPKMKLKKPKVKVKKTSRPKQTKHILTKVNPAKMPEIQLPEISGMGGDGGLGGGIGGGFDTMPDFEDISVFGAGQSIGNDFVGTFYDFKRDRKGRNIPMVPGEYLDKLDRFISSGWKSSKLARYYRSPKKLYATTFTMPRMPSYLAPGAFNEHDTVGYCWMVHYEGKLVHRDGITFRFRGMADDVMVVRVNGEIVLNGSANWRAPRWQSSSADSRKYHWFEVGDWITLAPCEPLDMEIIIGESPGGAFSSYLAVEEQGVEYEENFRGVPIFPVFKTTELSLDLQESIVANLTEGVLNLTNGPVFCDYDTSGSAVTNQALPESEPPEPERIPEKDEMRTWTCSDGKTMEAGFVSLIGDKAVLKDSRGKIRKIPFARLSDDDRLFIELAMPPKFNIDFSKGSSQRILERSPYSSWPVPLLYDYVFTTKLKQTSAGKYNHELKVESFAIGEEIDGDNYILLDRQESRFMPTKENGRSHSFSGKTVTLMNFNVNPKDPRRRGRKYGGYLVVVTDARGKVIQHASPYNWISENYEKLREFPVGKHFDKTITRVFPPRPKRTY